MPKRLWSCHLPIHIKFLIKAIKNIIFMTSPALHFPVDPWISEARGGRIPVKVASERTLCTSVEGFHFHPYPELFLQMEGVSRMKTPEEEILLEPGEALILPRGVPHGEFLESPDGPFKNFVLLITPVAWRLHFGMGGFGPRPSGREPRDYELPQSRLATEQMNLLLEALRADAPSALASSLLGSCLSFLENAKEIPRGDRSGSLYKPNLIGECLNLLEDAYNRSDCNVQSLARDLGCHVSHLSRLFAKTMGVTLSKFLLNKRMELAKSNLDVGGLNVSQTAYSCGFEDVSHFVATFRRSFGITPKQYSLQMAVVKRRDGASGVG